MQSAFDQLSKIKGIAFASTGSGDMVPNLEQIQFVESVLRDAPEGFEVPQVSCEEVSIVLKWTKDRVRSEAIFVPDSGTAYLHIKSADASWTGNLPCSSKDDRRAFFDFLSPWSVPIEWS
jgi:hypothetical protein